MSSRSAISRLIVLAWLFNLFARAFNWSSAVGFAADCRSMISPIGLSVGQDPISSRLGAFPVSGQSMQPARKMRDTRAMRMDRRLFADAAKNQQGENSIESETRSPKTGMPMSCRATGSRREAEDADDHHVTWAGLDIKCVKKPKMSR